eukprot:CAMPEP_0206287036 /NCGR_PEP_ID=MMETSP0106_2-20121207/904_1 /ASSEMBLY_ACC=CAM_ASM_000206 /TAXON_ID=81532 /ORGANISM="Acanthoeca-like sp., Strain 10tr" /LENGTH=263 /DNA_ID=CAMNT_0053717567 /DNA_START=60 /DNA_END=847 /DNA_ORIENTATION=+
MAHIYEINATVPPEAKSAFHQLLDSRTFNDILELDGCFFTEARVLERTSDETDATTDERWTIQFVSKSADGIDHYLKYHSAIAQRPLQQFSSTVKFSRKVYKLRRQVNPVLVSRVRTSDAPNEVPEAKLLGSSRRPVTADAFSGALGNRSDHAEFTTARYTDFRPHLAKGETNFADSKRISKTQKTDTRFFEGDKHKADARIEPDSLGITSSLVGLRNEEHRFFAGLKHFGQLDPLRASVENPDGSNTVAGVPAGKAPHEVDR